MPELLTTDEAAEYLRLSERKLYELVAERAVPCSKVTGRWLFPRAALDRWVSAGLIAPAALAQVAAPPIVGGSHDPLLEWALRESNSGLASLPEGSEEGLRRLTRGEVMIAAIHLHRLDGDDETANLDAVADAPGLHDAVVLGFARREQGILVAPGNPLGLSDMASIATFARAHGATPRRRRRATAAARAAGARRHRARRSETRKTRLSDRTRYRPGDPRRPHRLRHRHAKVAQSAGLDFLPLAWERFDLVMRQRDYFMKGPQALFDFMRAADASATARPNSAAMMSAMQARCGW